MTSLNRRIGGPNSDSYVNVAEADIIIAELPDDTAEWFDLTTEAKQYRLILAAQLIGTLPIRGKKAFCYQALSFPRDCQQVVYSIPREVKEAQVFLAYSVIHRGLGARPTSVTEEDDGSRVTQVSLGGLLSVSFAGSSVSSGTWIDKLVRSVQFPAYLALRRWIAQVKGRQVRPLDDMTCTVCPSTTTSTSTSSTTT